MNDADVMCRKQRGDRLRVLADDYCRRQQDWEREIGLEPKVPLPRHEVKIDYSEPLVAGYLLRRKLGLPPVSTDTESEECDGRF